MADVSTTLDFKVRKARVYKIPLTCARCGVDATRNSNNQNYCSSCAAELRRESNDKFNSEKTSRLRSEGRPVQGEEFPCADCGLLLIRTGPRHVVCPSCAKNRKRLQDFRYANARRDILARKARDWGAKNKERRKKKSAEYNKKHSERLKLKYDLKYKANPEPAKKRARDWYWKNREKVLTRMSSEEGRKYSREQMRKRLATEPQFKLHHTISRSIRSSVKDKKRRPWESLVGFTILELFRHIERQFLPGMKWSNHGKGKGRWHIDHIVPQSAFTFTSVEDADFKACWAITNLRPLWSRDNISKHDHRTHLL